MTRLDLQELERILHRTQQLASAYLSGLNARAVAPGDDALRACDALTEPLPEYGRSAQCVLDRLDTLASPATIASAGPRYFGFVTGGCLPVALAANWMAGTWDQNAFSRASSPLSAMLEDIVLQWMRELLALPAQVGGALVTGATMANFTALAAARHRVLQRVGWDVERDGLFGAPPITVVAGEQAHATLYKALGMLGLGRANVLHLPCDDQGRIVARRLPRLEAPAIVCLQAGNVNSGAFDPADALIPWAHDLGAWVHVDGAFGLWAAAAPAFDALTEGLATADSWAVDAHKWLNVPYDSGIALVLDADALAASMSIRAGYLVSSEARDPFDFTPESSRRMRAVEIWAALLHLGREGVVDLVERCCAYARTLALELSDAGFDVLNEVVLNQVIVSLPDASRNADWIEAIQRDGTCWCGPTQWRGITAMRISVSSWATDDDDVQRSLRAMIAAARSL